MSTGVCIARARLMPQARIALISWSEERRPKTRSVATRQAMGIEYESVPGMPPQRKSKTMPIDMPRARYWVTLNNNPTDITKLSTSSAMKKVVRKLAAM